MRLLWRLVCLIKGHRRRPTYALYEWDEDWVVTAYCLRCGERWLAPKWY